MERIFTKVHGSGNTFYLYETNDETEQDWVALTKWLCNKENEGGADGLLLVLPSIKAEAKMRVINADGSEASMCGNGLRCVARHVCEKLGVDEAIIETMKADLKVKKEKSIYGSIPTYAVEISPVSFQLESLPMEYHNQTEIQNQIIQEFSPTIHFTAVSVPNPHLIGIVDAGFITDNSHQLSLAELLNGENEFCSDGVNVSYAYPMKNDTIFVRTFERGVGFTNACGTAMTASALVAKLNNIVDSEMVTVFNPGGFVKCNVLEENGEYYLTLIGNATVICTYVIKMENNQYEFLSKEDTNEQLQYEQCIEIVKQETASFMS
ncbi:diaminopimelate epimerase [Ureibacillus massiliensis 4400831 = CIP 108448 = CCUG 49529]|uniref:Diaminopimelate epimerase n=1 Tax=Ureibacillus massiliensis 4400831 = CIP 108448 = CCUG 49529 TaxID=1211035 RepID=A0A0A3J1J0_9BACL|nr:diaminopimelate epimerase [Ureibacillus massiliensis]KGR89590.1 diaminopimelate epimerase [Ureibacillus massiliensis 4400831 = CIP 108448 = CCUG 49529]